MQLPPEAKLVYKGIIFDFYQWQQKMFDGSYQTFERLKRPDTVQVIVIDGDTILLCEDEQPDRGVRMAFIGGRIDQGEQPLDAAKRELLEETGIVADEWTHYKTYAPVTKIDWQLHYFIAKHSRKVKEQHLDAGGERINVKSVSFDAFIEITSRADFDAGEFTADMLRMQLDPVKLEEFKKLLFTHLH